MIMMTDGEDDHHDDEHNNNGDKVLHTMTNSHNEKSLQGSSLWSYSVGFFICVFVCVGN